MVTSTALASAPPASAPMYGRAAEFAELLDLLDGPSIRLVTVTGRSGVGKTRLAVEAMHRFAQAGRTVIAVALAGVTAAEFVTAEIADTAGVPFGSNVEPLDAIVDWLHNDEMLLVLDNFEHVRSASTMLGSLIERCPRITALVTSQAALSLRSEHVLNVGPLRVPALGMHDLATLKQEPSIAIYDTRATAVDPSFQLTDANVPDVAELCRRLEGLPLAIELAAAREPTLPAPELLRQLDLTGLDVLHHDRRDAPARHNDLRTTINCTYRLLSPRERRTLRRLSLVSGTFDLEAVEHLAAETTLSKAIDNVASLVDFHLVDPVACSEPPRFQIPSSIRAFAVEQLEELGEFDQALRAHLRFRTRQARESACAVSASDETRVLRRLQADRDDLLASLDAALGLELADDAIDLAVGLAGLWDQHGYDKAHAARVERAIELGRRDDWTTSRFAQLLSWSVRLGLRYNAGDRDELLRRHREAEAIARDLGDHDALLCVLEHSMTALPYTGDLVLAQRASVEGLALAAHAGNERRLGSFEVLTGMLAHQCHDDDRALTLGRSALARARRQDDHRTFVLAALLLLPLSRHHPEIATEVPPTEEAIDHAQKAGLALYEALLLPQSVFDAIVAGDRDAALRRSARSLEFARTTPNSPTVGYHLITTARVAAMCNDYGTAAFLHGTVRDTLPTLLNSMAPKQVDAYHAELARTRAVLGPRQFDAQLERGAQLSPGAALGSAIDWVERTQARHYEAERNVLSRTPTTGHNCGALTTRQCDVLRLLAAGLDNKEIATRLGLSPRTVMHHTTTIYRHLNVRGRAEAAVTAVRAGLVD
jgi:predicted ATPase/DNA-binding NarL/FixJ family response regulator